MNCSYIILITLAKCPFAFIFDRKCMENDWILALFTSGSVASCYLTVRIDEVPMRRIYDGVAWKLFGNIAHYITIQIENNV